MRGSVAHQTSASKAFQQGLYSPGAGSSLSPPRPRGVSGTSSRSRSPLRRVSFDADDDDEPTTRDHPGVMSPMGVAVAVALGSYLMDGPSRASDSLDRSERVAMALTPRATPRSGRKLFESNGRASHGFANFGDWVALHTKG